MSLAACKMRPGTELIRAAGPFGVALISIYNDLTGFRRLRKRTQAT